MELHSTCLFVTGFHLAWLHLCCSVCHHFLPSGLNNISLYVYVTFCLPIHLMIDSLFSYLDSCVCRTLVRTLCTHICTHICLSPYFQSFWVDRYSELNCWIIHANSLFNFLRNSTLFSMTAALIYIPISSAQGVWFLKWYLIVILMCFPNNQWCWAYVHVLLVFTILLVFDNIIVSVYPSKCLLWHFSFFFPECHQSLCKTMFEILCIFHQVSSSIGLDLQQKCTPTQLVLYFVMIFTTPNSSP